MKLVYLACPYSHEDYKVREERTQKATALAAALSMNGYNVFSPLTHSHAICQCMPDNYHMDADFWLERDFQILDCCQKLIVLCLTGWEDSYGVTKEIEYAKENNIPIVYIPE